MSDEREAPDFVPVDQTGFGSENGNCFAAAVASLTGLPLAELTAELGFGTSLDEPEHWYDRAQRVMRSHGFELSYGLEQPEGYAIYSGMSPRGLLHSTIGCDGEVVHDPHPSRAGIESVRDYITVRRIEAVAPRIERQYALHDGGTVHVSINRRGCTAPWTPEDDAAMAELVAAAVKQFSAPSLVPAPIPTQREADG